MACTCIALFYLIGTSFTNSHTDGGAAMQHMRSNVWFNVLPEDTLTYREDRDWTAKPAIGGPSL